MSQYQDKNTKDPFGEGLYKYTFSNICYEKPDVELGDECVKVFLNTKGHVGEVSRELKAFLNFVEKSTVENAATIKDSYVTELSERIEDIKKDEALGGVFMTFEEKLDEVREASREEGIKEGIKKNSLDVAKGMKDKGYDINDIVELTKLTREEIESL